MGDPFLNYFALFLLVFPYRTAESRQHPHQDAIHAAGWVSLFTLHVLWPFLWIWAMVYRPERGWGFATRHGESDTAAKTNPDELDDLRRRISELEKTLKAGGR